jgi:hypothetical protein
MYILYDQPFLKIILVHLYLSRDGRCKAYMNIVFRSVANMQATE